MQAEEDILEYVRCQQELQGDGRDWCELALDCQGWNELALSFVAHIVTQLSGTAQHARCDTDVVDGP